MKNKINNNMLQNCVAMSRYVGQNHPHLTNLPAKFKVKFVVRGLAKHLFPSRCRYFDGPWNSFKNWSRDAKCKWTLRIISRHLDNSRESIKTATSSYKVCTNFLSNKFALILSFYAKLDQTSFCCFFLEKSHYCEIYEFLIELPSHLTMTYLLLNVAYLQISCNVKCMCMITTFYILHSGVGTN